MRNTPAQSVVLRIALSPKMRVNWRVTSGHTQHPNWRRRSDTRFMRLVRQSFHSICRKHNWAFRTCSKTSENYLRFRTSTAILFSIRYSYILIFSVRLSAISMRKRCAYYIKSCIYVEWSKLSHPSTHRGTAALRYHLERILNSSRFSANGNRNERNVQCGTSISCQSVRLQSSTIQRGTLGYVIIEVLNHIREQVRTYSILRGQARFQKTTHIRGKSVENGNFF